MVEEDTLMTGDLPEELRCAVACGDILQRDAKICQPPSLEAAEEEAIRVAILACQGNLTQAARELGIAKSTLYAKVKKHGPEGILPAVWEGE